MLDKLKDNITALVAVIGVVGTIGAGFTVYGTMNEKIAQLESAVGESKPFNPDGLVGEMGKQSSRIAVLEKTNQILELEIKELKASNKNPLAN